MRPELKLTSLTLMFLMLGSASRAKADFTQTEYKRLASCGRTIKLASNGGVVQTVEPHGFIIARSETALSFTSTQNQTLDLSLNLRKISTEPRRSDVPLFPPALHLSALKAYADMISGGVYQIDVLRDQTEMPGGRAELNPDFRGTLRIQPASVSVDLVVTEDREVVFLALECSAAKD